MNSTITQVHLHSSDSGNYNLMLQPLSFPSKIQLPNFRQRNPTFIKFRNQNIHRVRQIPISRLFPSPRILRFPILKLKYALTVYSKWDYNPTFNHRDLPLAFATPFDRCDKIRYFGGTAENMIFACGIGYDSRCFFNFPAGVKSADIVDGVWKHFLLSS